MLEWTDKNRTNNVIVFIINISNSNVFRLFQNCLPFFDFFLIFQHFSTSSINGSFTHNNVKSGKNFSTTSTKLKIAHLIYSFPIFLFLLKITYMHIYPRAKNTPDFFNSIFQISSKLFKFVFSIEKSIPPRDKKYKTVKMQKNSQENYFVFWKNLLLEVSGNIPNRNYIGNLGIL